LKRLGGVPVVPRPTASAKVSAPAVTLSVAGVAAPTLETPAEKRARLLHNTFTLDGVSMHKGPGTGEFVPLRNPDYVQTPYVKDAKKRIISFWRRHQTSREYRVPRFVDVPGTGKTSIYRDLACDLQAEFFLMSAGPHTAEENFTGKNTSNAKYGEMIEVGNNNGGAPRFVEDRKTIITTETPFMQMVKASQKDGALVMLCLDEFNRVLPEEKMWVNRAIDILAGGGGWFKNDQTGESYYLDPEKILMGIAENPVDDNITGVHQYDGSTDRRTEPLSPEGIDPKDNLLEISKGLMENSGLVREYPILERLLPEYIEFVMDYVDKLNKAKRGTATPPWWKDGDSMRIKVPEITATVIALKNTLIDMLDKNPNAPREIDTRYSVSGKPGVYTDEYVGMAVMQFLDLNFVSPISISGQPFGPAERLRRKEWCIARWGEKITVPGFKAKIEKGVPVLDTGSII
jgi:hypothetical protein